MFYYVFNLKIAKLKMMKNSVFIILLGIIKTSTGQCTWQSEFASSTWHDSTRGDITFAATTMTGWSANIRSQTFNTWECVDSSSSSYILMKATNQLSYSQLNFFVYACLQLTKITDVSYLYYLQNQQESNGGYERLRFSTTNTLTTVSDICDTTASVPTQEFHVLIKSGMETAAPITCPTQFLYSADYVYNDTSTYACADSSDVWDVCSDSTEMTFNYTTCSQQIAFSSGGKLWCVASVGQCVSVYNQDSSLTASTRRFSCLCSDGESVAIAPNNCTASQTPGVIPTGPDGTSAIGHVVTVGTKYVDCAPVTETTTVAAAAAEDSGGGGVNAGLIAGIVIGLLVLIAVIIIIVYCVRSKKRNGKNKVNESAKPILLGKESARVETVNETSRANRKREKTTLSHEGSRLDKSMLDGRASVTSIGLEPKSERGMSREKTAASKRSMKGLDKEKSSITLINVKAQGEGDKEDKKDKENPVKTILSRLPCWPKEKESEPTKEPETVPVVVASQTPPASPKKGAADKKGSKKGAAAKGGKGKGGKKGGKKEKGEKPTKGDKNREKEKTKSEEMLFTDVQDDELTETPKANEAVKQPGPQFTSTPIPKDSKEKPLAAGGKMPTFVSLPSSLHKPEDKKTGWPFLVCCAGTGDKQPRGTEEPQTKAEPETVVETKKPTAKGKTAAKVTKGKPTKNGGEKGKKKGGTSETNGKIPSDTRDPDEKDEGAESDKLERAKTMPERAREKTVLSMTDAEKVKVDVYVPNEQTQLQLKDTVTVIKDKNGDVPMEKSKTTLGLTRPVSSVSKGSKPSSVKASAKAGKGEKGDKDKVKGKDKGKAAKGGKEKKGGGKKKKK